MSFHVVHALILRYLFLYARSRVRLIEVFFWPIMDLFVWVFLGSYLDATAGDSNQFFIPWLVGGVILWDVMFRSQQSVAMAFLEDVWAGNLLNVFAAPIRATEYIAAAFFTGLIRIGLSLAIVSVLAIGLVQFNLFSLNLAMIPFFGNLLLFGWALGMASTALIIRYGKGAEALAWAVPFLVQPFTAVFYPVARMPEWSQPIAWCFPSTYVFEGMRGVFAGNAFSWPLFWGAIAWNAIFFSLATLFFGNILRYSRRKGTLTKVTSM